MTASPESIRLKGLRNLLDCADIKAVSLVAEPDGMGLGVTRLDGRLIVAARFTRDANATDMEALAFGFDAVKFLIGLLDRAFDEIRNLKGALPREPAPDSGPANFAAEAAIKCGEPAFKKFLMEKHGLESPATDEACAQKLRQMLGITTRSVLNSDDAAAARWKQLRGEFQGWRRI